jgi:predicted GNAT family acetyltransferase
VVQAIARCGIAAALVVAALAYARQTGRKVVAECSYAQAWRQRHPEHQDLWQ